MAATSKSYPFPVLGNEDDIKGLFKPLMRYTLEPNEVVIECEFELSNPTIEKLISEDNAAYFVQVECGNTFYRRTFTSTEPRLKLNIEAGDLRERVDVSFCVCAVQDIQDYSPDGIHPDLAGEPTAVEKGDVLADGGTGSFMADKTFDPLKAPVSSFMKIKEGNEKSAPMAIEYGGDQIIIKLSKDDYKNYVFARKFAPSSLHSSLVLPALIDVLYIINKDDGRYEGAQWFDRIKQICRERDIVLDDPLIAAQRMLGKPVERGLKEVKTLSSDNSEDEV
jgi:hypothetical protein